MSSPPSASVTLISDCFIKPKSIPEESKQPLHLSTWDLRMPCAQYIQKGLLFAKPPSSNSDAQMQDLLLKLKESLSLTLVHFYPLAGRLATLKQENPPIYTIFVDCNNSPGARFIHASVDLTIADILSPTDVPVIVQSFFDHHKAINHDGHTLSLLSIQVTELKDGIFIGCSANHMLVDGTSYWHFFNTWSEIFNAKAENIAISRPPIHKRWIPEGYGPVISLPFTHHDQFIQRHEAPQLRERFFHFSAESLAKLKAKANAECNTTKISTLQALSAHVWRCIIRTRNYPPDQETSCRMATNNRHRLNPPLPEDYVGNYIQPVQAIATAGELLENGIGWSAWKLHQAVQNHTDEVIRKAVDGWLKSPVIYQMSLFDPYSIMMGSSPRFNKYGNEFGLGKALALRSGYSNKFDGKVSLYPGAEGGGSMDLETCLLPHSMSLLESDPEFMGTKGLLFAKPPSFNTDTQMKDLLLKLQDSLSLTLVHFYPLAGRLVTLHQENPHIYTIYVDCNNSPGARFIHASVDLTVDDVLSPTDVPVIFQSCFDHHNAINHDGHNLSLLSIQVTELKDGIFIGRSANRMLVDGTSYWHFFNTWSEIFSAKGENVVISRPPINTRHGPIVNLPFTHHDQFIQRHEAPPLRERIFHFSAETLAKLKAKANVECNTTKISSLQVLTAHVWRCITRARNFPPDKETSCRMTINNRRRFNSPLPEDYVGNYVQHVQAATTAGELLENGIGWSAWN
ncbi:OLC1v1016814C1 [Oldenlandia corymbosa var. corymbosa]|uniref:OLC1v1016814C1 n=1 Tax=Oldenlandia corymbosa var. corymbosa TaxID=529605 RepID=A0AAV1E812_OLDCO|nr:OLC1v1016814C1 [Oldenlandia corymbosa var. corymbosa]